MGAACQSDGQLDGLLDAVEAGMRGERNAWAITPGDVAALRSDAGLVVEGCVVWLRDDDRTLVLWLGSRLDYGMDAVVERRLER